MDIKMEMYDSYESGYGYSNEKSIAVYQLEKIKEKRALEKLLKEQEKIKQDNEEKRFKRMSESVDYYINNALIVK